MVKQCIFKQNYTIKLFVSYKISYYCCFGFRGNLEFQDFLQKKFIRLATGHFFCPVPLVFMGGVGKWHYFCDRHLVNLI